MTARKLRFTLVERKNMFAPRGREFALVTGLDHHTPWTLTTWEKRPTLKVLKQAQEIVIRSFEFYHGHSQAPEYNIQVEETAE